MKEGREGSLCVFICIYVFTNVKYMYEVHILYTNGFMMSKESELHHSTGSLIDGAHPSQRTDRDYLGCYYSPPRPPLRKRGGCRWVS